MWQFFTGGQGLLNQIAEEGRLLEKLLLPAGQQLVCQQAQKQALGIAAFADLKGFQADVCKPCQAAGELVTWIQLQERLIST